MDLKEKVEDAVKRCVHADQIRLEDDEGVYGFVVSPQFRSMSAIDRQTLIYDALHGSSVKFSKRELRRGLAIAALTPAEYETIDHEGRFFRR
jgi:acid stress-induced BolA-like protein IbaG/YrbA